MAQITKEISVDVAQLNRFAAIVAKQYDRQSRFLKVHILDNGTEISVDPGATVTINARREDGVGKSFAGSVNSDGTVSVPLTYWMLELDGTVKCDISIIVNNEITLTSTLFELEVEQAACDNEAITQDEDYGLLVTLIGEVRTTTAATKQSYETSASQLRSQYESSASQLRSQYEASMRQAIDSCDSAVAAVQLVTAPFFINDTDHNKQYTASIQVRNGKPVLIYDELNE